ncbi:MAG: hypothetical protein Q9163_001293 [Psora crenata]
MQAIDDERKAPSEVPTSSYVLRPLVEDIPLSAEGQAGNAHITCVELCGDNLYVGTSRAEILHFVSIPGATASDTPAPSYIFASRLQPAYSPQPSLKPLEGVQQILVLPKVQKACILCNGTLSFYSLPELSPAFGNNTVSNCTWVGGGVLGGTDGVDDGGEVVMICVKNKVRLVRIGDEVRRVRDIQFPGCIISSSRGDYACVADAQSYALLDVKNQQKITLFPISSLDENAAAGKVEDLSTGSDSIPARSSSLARPFAGHVVDSKGHGRSTSLGALVGGIGRREGSPKPRSRDRSALIAPVPLPKDTSPLPSPSHAKTESNPENPTPLALSADRALVSSVPAPPPRSDSLRSSQRRPEQILRPHICSPTPNEFLLTTGTSGKEAGMAIFVNLDGDVVRGTLEFSRYPQAVVVDGDGCETDNTQLGKKEGHEGYVLASMLIMADGMGRQAVLEVQRWDIEDIGNKEWMQIPCDVPDDPKCSDSHDSGVIIGLRTVNTEFAVQFPEIGALLRGKRLELPDTESTQLERLCQRSNRDREEFEFGSRLGGQTTKITLWSGSKIWSVARNPSALKLDATLQRSLVDTKIKEHNEVDRGIVIGVANAITGQEPASETEFLSLAYIRQKASLILFADLLSQVHRMENLPPADLRITERLMMDGGLDPRAILALVPTLREEIVEGDEGIWIHAGLIPVMEYFFPKTDALDSLWTDANILNFIKRYLGGWRQRKGFGSIADESEVFQTIDAALLRLLLVQDSQALSYPSKPSPERTELYSMVDSGMDCFDRATTILEQHHRLFVLSRLYQSRRMARKVLETWKRIIEGEIDEGGGLIDGENEVRRYLVNIKDTALVDEYGSWLARRNPALGVQVFTNDSSRVKLEPHQVLMLLRRRAPDAVKVYLEHLVFGKKNVSYANELISYYLDSVLTVLQSSDDARKRLAETYEIYRALRPPKPTYREYIMANTLSEPWWHDRLRLLELIGGSHGSDFSYDVSQVLHRVEPFEQDLVPESIILDGRQGRHRQALRLLTHGLSDYHTAVNYCLLGGASIFHPTQGSVAPLTRPSQEEQAILFGYLLTEFLRIEIASDRLEQTSELLARFGSWYDVRQVLDQIPESWSVELVSSFLTSALRKLVHEKNEVMMTKALSGAENLQVAHAFVEKCEAIGPQVESTAVT